MYAIPHRLRVAATRRSRLWALDRLEARVLLTAEFEPNDSITQANGLLVPNDTLTGRIATVRDTDYVSAFLQQGETWKVSLNGEGENGHPLLGPSFAIVTASDEVLAAAADSHTFAYTAPSTGTYFLRLTAANAFGDFAGSYTVQSAVEAYAGATEIEPNNTPTTATPLAGTATLRGSLASGSDVDYFSFSGSAGQAVAVKFTSRPGANPSSRLYAPGGGLLATDLTGVGLSYVLTQSGTYRLGLQSDNAAGTVSGPYVGQLVIAAAATAEAEPANDLTGAQLINLGPYVVSGMYLSPDATFTVNGLTGSYVNQNLRGVASQADWRTTQVISGTRLDPVVHFAQTGWGRRAQVGLTGGTDNDWNEYSVQWDGFLKVVTPGARVSLASDDGGRMWIDLNGDGVFNGSGSEFINNNWGAGQDTTLSAPSVPLAAGTYRVRIQFEEGGGGNNVYLLWDDAAHSNGMPARVQRRSAVGTLSGLNDTDTFAVDLAATGFFEFRLQTTPGRLSTQNRELALYNEFGQLLEYSTEGVIATDRHHYRPEATGRHYLTVRATSDTGLGGYAVTMNAYREFPAYRDVPLFFHDNTGYNHPEQIPEFHAFFESRFDGHQIDLTATNPGTGVERVDWTFRYDGSLPPGAGGAAGGYFGERRPSGGGSGTVSVDWTRLQDVWHGLSYHENGHGVGLPHARHPLSIMSYGGQYDYFPTGSYLRIGGDGRIPTPKVQNERNYLDWTLESGRVVLEGEDNGTLAAAQQLARYFADMAGDADPRNDGVVVAGRVAGPADIDTYSFAAAAGQEFTLDIDAAEFQYPLDARLDLLDAAGNVLAGSQAALDRDSGVASVDPYLTYRFAAAGTFYLRVTGENGTAGNYRLKVTPEQAFDRDGPRVAAAWPDGGAQVDGTRQLVFWFNDQLDPATLTAATVEVRGQATGVRAGTTVFDPLDSTLTWRANAALPPDTYTVTFAGGVGGVADLRGNRLDGETDGALNWPEVSGDGTPGGNFTTRFVVTQADATPAVVTYSAHYRHEHDRVMFDVGFSDELDVASVFGASFVLRGAGADHAFNTADDTLAPVDQFIDRIGNTVNALLRAYTRAVPDPDTYRLEANFQDAAGHAIALARTFEVTVDVAQGSLFTDAGLTTPGLVGSYVNQSLRGVASQADWRTTQTIAGTRVDPVVTFSTDSFGLRSEVNLTGGSDANWDDFSVQWDGFLVVPANGVRLFTRSDDGSRMWVDLNGDGVFNASGAEFVNNNWGSGQGVTTGPASVPLAAGTYRVRVQYEEGFGGNRMQLAWDYAGGAVSVEGLRHGLAVADVNVQPNTAVTAMPPALEVTFSAAVNPATLTPANFRVWHSADARFFDGNDTLLTDADGQIAYDAARRRASFQPAAWAAGYYLIELKGDAAGVAAPGGRFLDGEYLDTNIAGSAPLHGWRDAASGDSRPGGDYHAYFRYDVAAPPRVQSVVVAGGAGQRSRVTSIAVTFDAVVTFANPNDVAAAFQLARIGGGSVGFFTATAAVVNGVTVVTLDGFAGAETEFGSLADGRYALTVRANQVSAGGRQLDGDGDGVGGDDYALAGSLANGLFRLFGDANGDGVVNASDFGPFRTAFGTSVGNTAYRDWLDFDGDGFINAFDFAMFRDRFGTNLFP